MIGVLADSGAVRAITSTEPSRIASVRADSTDMMLLRSAANGSFPYRWPDPLVPCPALATGAAGLRTAKQPGDVGWHVGSDVDFGHDDQRALGPRGGTALPRGCRRGTPHHHRCAQRDPRRLGS